MLALCARLLHPFAFLALVAHATHAQSVRINGPMLQPGTGDVLDDYSFSPSGARMVFRADVEQDGVFELYSAPNDASAPALRLTPGVHVRSFAGALGRALYLAEGNT